MKKSGYSPFLLIVIIAVFMMGQYIFSKRHEIVLHNINKNHLTPIKKLQNSSLLIKLIPHQTDQKKTSLKNQNMIQLQRQYTEQELSKMTEENFKSVLSETEIALPLLSDIKKLPEEALHHTPGLIIRAGKELGLIKEILKTNKSFENLALEFYKRCAQNKKGVTPVRALCLTNILEINKKNGIKIDTGQYPQHILELSKMVIDL